ncbi:TolC family protein [Cytophagaceae bacterium YF14B1]|uniref:TolC family protein n=1 Tax=Xanthocytophaga flava TaxID=3048013 RepID=A0AAE3QTE8_9BACT|nr:TolC family protein [Xanthocytophaga flavus]MDJ1484596.1 TolC family protein [Xanthocytophaga flavus]
MSNLNKKWIVASILWICILGSAWSQTPSLTSDTLTLSLQEAENIFLTKNYLLLAQKYNINIAEANIRQSKLWANPNFFVESNFYNPQTGKFFQYGKNSAADIAASQYNKGSITLQLQQLIYTAGKRSKLVQLAESNKNLQSLAFEDLLRNLRYQLHSSYASLYFDMQSYTLLRNEEKQQKSLVNVMQQLLSKGGISAYEVTRLEAELRSIQSDILNLQGRISDEETTLRTFLAQKDIVFIKPTEVVPSVITLPQLKTVMDSALTNRPDVSLSQEQVNNAHQSLVYEKARRTPDLVAGLTFDKYASAFMNYTGLSVAMDLPVFNRNQGNIQVAQLQLESAKKSVESQQITVQNEVMNAYEKFVQINQLNEEISATYRESLKNISAEATKNYNQRTINLLDYLDKIRTYKQASLKLIDLQNTVFQSQQYLNFVTNTKVF